jgi:hypothetical protein
LNRLVRVLLAIAFALTSLMPGAAVADWTVVEAGSEIEVAKGKMSLTPAEKWNKSSSRPSAYGELWTQDGFALNELSFLAAVPNGKTLFHNGQALERPLPKFKADMLLTDLAELFESTNRIVLATSLFEMGTVEPLKLGDHDAVRFRYSYAIENDELKRSGEAVAAIVNGKLYLVNFVAPSIHFFDRDIEKVRALIETVKIAS